MRDIFEDISTNQPLDPTEAAQRNMRPQLRKRFYAHASAGEPGEGGYPVLLDGKSVRTPARRILAVPSRRLAEALAAEWDAQAEVIDPARMPLTRLVNSIIDGVVDAPQPVADEVAKYLGSDLLFYRADGPPGLLALQAKHWDPVLDWARDAHGARFILAEGVMFAHQPEHAIAAMGEAIPSDPWRLGGVHSAMTLTGSALLALALAEGRLDLDAAWQAAHVDEDWNAQQWGSDDLALDRRRQRFAEMKAAADLLAAL